MAEKDSKLDVKKWFRYDWVIRNVPFFLFLTLLAIIYIANGHYADNTIRKINKTTRMLKEQEYEFKALNGKLMFQNRMTELSKVLDTIGLHETMDQPFFLKDSIGNKPGKG
jgi:hypothetical protein